MFICGICETPFDEPLIHKETTVEEGRLRADVEALCPICASPDFTEAGLCPKCKSWKPKQDRLCGACRADLLRRFTAFADKLTAEEEEQLDDWMDGESVTNRRNWD